AISSRSGSSRPLEHVDEHPALGPRQRPVLDHSHDVALVRIVVLVVRMQRAGAAHDLLVPGVTTGNVDPHRDRLLGLVRNDDPLAHLPYASDGGVYGRELAGLRSLDCPRAFLQASSATPYCLGAALDQPLRVALLRRARLARRTRVAGARPAPALLG